MKPDIRHHAGLVQRANLSLAPATQTQMLLLLHLKGKDGHFSCVGIWTPQKGRCCLVWSNEDVVQIKMFPLLLRPFKDTFTTVK